MINSSKLRLRRLVLAATAGVFALGLASAPSLAEDAKSGNDTRSIHVEFMSSAVDSNWKKMFELMYDYIDELGEETNASISMNVSDAALNVDTQISQIQNAVVKHPDVIIIDPVDSRGVIPTMTSAKAQGIKLFTFRPAPTDPPDLYDGSFVTTMEERMAEQMTAWIDGLLAADPNLVLNVAVIYGSASQNEQLIRGDIIKKVAANNPDRVHVVAEKFADWSLEIAQNSTSDFITAHPDLNLVVTANNQMATGAANAITTAGKSDEVMLATYDVDVPAVKAVVDGKITFVTGIEFKTVARSLLRSAVEVVLGTFPGKIDMKPVYAITKENAAEVLPQLVP